MRLGFRSCFAFILAVSYGGGIVAAPPRKVVQALRAEKAPVTDGDLGDPAWQAAPEITGFPQYDPMRCRRMCSS